ncbi:hypothetical protein [Dyella jiangningensis]|uniref:Zinc-finger domain-containing protein n=1 Tax=Dyella jiangningensis TaxID=1379159 RepID=A0A328NXT4_9GAMM|nr:hypothetical protein [Dyella jiangningensis]RAO75010.1 hypothetical protein CA260_12900 [Dyella jiangningensis]
MNPIDDDILQAYVDGELDAASAAELDAAMAHDAALAERVKRARDLRAQLRSMFDPVLEEPVPEHLSTLLRPATSKGSNPAEPQTASASKDTLGNARRHAARRRRMLGAALAASIVLAAMSLWWWRPDDELTRMQSGQAYAAGALAHTLDQALASEPDARAPIAIGLSFRGADGHVCRTFVVRTPPSRAGLACHDDSGWALAVLGPAMSSEGGEWRQAATSLTPEVQAAVDARLNGSVFDATQERAARDAGWR